LQSSWAAKCTYSLSPTNASFAAAGGSGSVTINTTTNCSWTAATTNSWLHTTSSGSGTNLVNYTVDANGGSNSRTGAITAGGQTFTVTQTGVPPSLATALDTTNLVWVTATDYPWTFENTVTHDGVDAAVSGNKFIANSVSWLQTTIVGPGTIGFWWKVDSDITPPPPDPPMSFDDFEFQINGVEQDYIMGQIDWNYREFPVPAGTNTLTWQYVKDGQFNTGNDSAWLDLVTWSPGQPIDLGSALNICGASWSTGGSDATDWAGPAQGWAGQTNVTHDGQSAARSGTIYLSQETWMQTVVSGVTNLSFWWKVSSQTNYDFLEFYTNDILAKRISGEVNWQSNFFRISTNATSLKWRYAMTNGIYATQGQEAAWVDQVVFSPSNSAAPIVTLLGSNPMSIECHGSFTDPGATAQDVCSGAPLSVATNGTVNPNATGSYTVLYIATNASGTATTNSRTVNVVDTTPPQVTINGANPLTVECHDSFSDPGATALDACAGSLSVSTNGSVDPNFTGSYTVTYVATDPSGNSTTNTRTVNVVDTTPPQVTLNGPNPMIVECHGAFSDPGATAQDLCAGPLSVVTNVSVNPNLPGSYTIQYVATDPSNNSTTNTRSVNVVDTTPPQITLNGTNPMTIECHSGYAEPGATATDLCVGSVAVQVSGAVLQDSPGMYIVTYTATDGQNSATNTRTVNVVDTTPPMILFSFTNMNLAASGNCQALLPDLTGTNYIVAVDNCSSVTVTQTPLAGATVALGTNLVVLIAVDATGNTTSCTNTVIVSDTNPPSMICPSDLNISADPGQCWATNVALGTPIVSDNCGSVATTSNAPAIFAVGTNIVIWTAMDIYGNSTNGAQMVVVLDTELPLISAPATVVVTADPGKNAVTNVSLGTPVTSDNCGVAGVTNDAPSSFPIGTNTVNWTVTDIHGNVASAPQTVVVNPAPRLPHRITSIVRNGDGSFTLTFAGTAGVQYFIQISSNLFDWVSVQTNIADSNGTWTYLDSPPSTGKGRFFRSVQP
jgi:hypothetical protein